MSALKPCPRSIQVGEFEVAISGGVWVAIRVDGLKAIKNPCNYGVSFQYLEA